MANELTVRRQQLPQTLDGLAKFVLIGREKLTAVKAEIRAIDKLELAQEVRDQKREEAQWLSSALLDAEVKIGDLLREIPTANGQRRDLEPRLTGEPRFHEQRTKAEIITDLGFDRMQAQRFETLSENKDLVEQVKQEAIENDDLPTRSRVLDLARERNRRGQGEEQSYYDYMAECKKIALKYNNTIYKVYTLDADQEDFKMWAELLDDGVRESSLRRAEKAMENIARVVNFLRRPLK